MTHRGDLQGERSGQRMLLIAYHFPPSAAVGGLRVANFAKHLPSFGWQPHVLTIRDEHIVQQDAERLRGLENVVVHKATVLPTVQSIYATLKARWGGRPDESPGASIRSSDADDGKVAGTTVLARIKLFILSFLVLPDFERGWILPAIIAGIRAVRRHRIGWILTSCPPYSAHVVGLVVRAFTGARWVADFRDPWMTAEYKQLYPTTRLSRAVDAWLERRVVARADLVLLNVERLREAYVRAHSHVPPSKFQFIPNSVSVTPPSDHVPTNKYDCFTISYTGSLYVGRSPEPVLKALARLIERGVLARDRVQLKLIGNCREIGGTPTVELARKYGLESVVELCDTVPRSEALAIVRRSHLALLLAPGLPYQIPAKLYDYLGTGTRILAIAEEGGTADLLAETSCGQAFAPDDVAGIASFLERELASLPSMEVPPSVLARFGARSMTERLVKRMALADSAVPADLSVLGAASGD